MSAKAAAATMTRAANAARVMRAVRRRLDCAAGSCVGMGRVACEWCVGCVVS